MTGNIWDQMCQGIDKTQLVLVFVTQRYIEKVQGTFSDRDNCKLEFQYAVGNKSLQYVIPVNMEHRTRKPAVWPGKIKGENYEFHIPCYISMYSITIMYRPSRHDAWRSSIR